ncbi:MAG: O-antigen ligase family protein [Ruminococcaceae bacterium]|nr:O-antigen ligase family protein [Oscillospiraceae bacterium]
MTNQIKAPRITMHTAFYVAWALFLASIFVRNVFDIRFPIIIVLALSCLPAIVGDRNEIIASAISLLPMTTAFQFKYALLLIMVIYIVKYMHDVKYMSGFIIIAVMFAWELLHGLVYEISLLNTVRGFAELIFCAFLMSLSNVEFKHEKIFRMIAISTTVAGTIVLLNLLTSNGFDIVSVFEGGYRFGKGDTSVTEYGMNYNSNDMGMLFNAAMCGIFYLIKLKRTKPIDYVMLPILLIYGIFTQSRAFIICFAFILVLFIISSGTLKNKVKLLCSILIFCSIVILLLNLLLPDVLENYISRFGEDDISNGRFDILKLYGELILSDIRYFIFGIGMNDISSKAGAIIPGIIASAHNGTQEIIVAWGIVGLILIIAFIIAMIRKAKMSGNKLQLLNVIMLLFLILYVQSGQFLTADKCLLALCLSYVCISINLRKAENTYEFDC